MRIIKPARIIFQGLLLTALLSSCNSTKFLAVDEFLLKKNQIKFIEDGKIENKRGLKYELSTLYKQRENGKFFFIPREWFYLKTQDPQDTTKFDAWIRRVIGEPPTIYDEALTNASVEAMDFYLQYKGYFNAEVFADEAITGKQKVKVNYYVEPRKKFIIDSTFFISRDPGISRILKATEQESVLQSGTGLEGALYEQEKDRITRTLRNNGYAYFQSNYIAPLEADTTLKPHKANVYIEVLPPQEDSLHQVYHIGDISIFPEYDPTLEEDLLQDTLIGGFLFRSAQNTFDVKPQAIINAIYLRQGALFNQDNYDRTSKALGGLSIFRFVRIKQEIDSLYPNKLNFRIELTSNKRMKLELGFDLNYTNRSASTGTGNLIGISANPSLQHRNFLGSAELFASNLSAGIEVNPDPQGGNFWNTIDIRLQTDLFFPKFLDYLGLWRTINRWSVKRKEVLPSYSVESLEDQKRSFYQLLRENATSRLTASYNYLLLLDFYSYNLLNASYGFDMQRANKRYVINHIGIDYLRPVTREAFQDILMSNPFLDRSFGQQLFVSLLFRDFNFTTVSRPDQYGRTFSLSTNVELAGAEIWAGNVLYNAFSLQSDTLRIGRIDFSQYVKGEIDLRYNRVYTPKRSLAARLNIGIARPFGYTLDVPYVKQFFVGGPNSIRGWAARGLGPGGFEDPLIQSPQNRLLFYQTGDFKFETNVEYRFEIFWRLKGAFFLDAGNVWTINKDTTRCGSQFLFRSKTVQDCVDGPTRADPFYKQIALGSGFGFRFDFTYFIFRLDMGVKLRNPFPLQGEPGTAREKDYWTDFSKWKLKDLNFNLGLGYPF